MKVTILLLLLVTSWGHLRAQDDPNQVRSQCQHNLDSIDRKMIDLNDTWEQEKRDLRAGLFCSKCMRTKAELDKTYPGGFYKHVGDVHGQVVPATQEQMDQKYNDYLNQFNDLKKQSEDMRNSCNDQIQSAWHEQQQERQQALKAWQDSMNLVRQQNDEKIREQAEKNKQDLQNMFQQRAEEMKAGMQGLGQMANSIAQYNNGQSGGTPDNKSLATGGALHSADDYAASPTETEEQWHQRVMEILNNEQNKYLVEPATGQTYDQSTGNEGSTKDCGQCFVEPFYNPLQEAKDYVADKIKDWVSNQSVQLLRDKYSGVNEWYERYENYAPMIQAWVTNVQSAVAINKATDCLLNQNLATDDPEQQEQNFRNYQRTFAYSLPVVGKLMKGYATVHYWIYGNDGFTNTDNSQGNDQ